MYFPTIEDMTDEELITFALRRGVDASDLREAVDAERDSSAQRAAVIRALEPDRETSVE